MTVKAGDRELLINTGFFGKIGEIQMGAGAALDKPPGVAERHRRSLSVVILSSSKVGSRDQIIEWLFSHGWYDVDPDTGTVTNPRTGKILKTCLSNGYPVVTLYGPEGARTTAAVHRLIAIKLWGAAAVFGKEVAHLDRVKIHSYAANLALMTPKEHHDYDKSGGFKNRKTSWGPCARCGDPDGPIESGHCVTPVRYDGTRFGIDGRICARCYHDLRRYPTNKSTWTLADAQPLPCAVCGVLFQPRKETRRYCSAKCRQSAYRQRFLSERGAR